jgi:tRNA pseudouridine32 synthase/23S rRNA pseudouridine746 synthase
MADSFHISVDTTEARAVDLLADASGLSRQVIKQAMQKGAVWLSHKGKPRRLRRAKKIVNKGDELHFHYDPDVLASEIEAPQLIADEGDYSVWYKPYAVLSQGSKWGDHCTINRWVELHHQPQRPAIIVHRLDRATTGLMLLAHSKSAAAGLTKMFERRQLEKYYRAKVYGDIGNVCQPITIDRELDGKKALSHVQCKQSDSYCSIVDVQIETGRKHQIRRHLSGLGFPVVGDRLYGFDGGKGAGQENLQLTACQLIFQCPLTGEARDYRLDESFLPSL